MGFKGFINVLSLLKRKKSVAPFCKSQFEQDQHKTYFSLISKYIYFHISFIFHCADERFLAIKIKINENILFDNLHIFQTSEIWLQIIL